MNNPSDFRVSRFCRKPMGLKQLSAILVLADLELAEVQQSMESRTARSDLLSCTAAAGSSWTHTWSTLLFIGNVGQGGLTGSSQQLPSIYL